MSQPVISQQKHTFSMTCAVEVNIRAGAARVWRILTDAGAFGRWNSTVSRVEGEIAEGNRLKLHVPGTARIFTPLVSGVLENRRMTWSDGVSGLFKGVRIFELTPCPDGSTDFRMEERFSGLMLLFLKSLLPDFGPIFASYAQDLKREAEEGGAGL